MKPRTTFIFLLLASFLMMGCTETHTTDANECYSLWSGKKPETGLILLHGDYKQIGGFIKEYTLFMELKADSSWRSNFISINELIPDQDTWSPPADAPIWFKPDNRYKVWKDAKPFAESRYLEDTGTGKMFIYEVE